MARISGTTQRPPIGGPQTPPVAGQTNGEVTVGNNYVGVSGNTTFYSTSNVATFANTSGYTLNPIYIDQLISTTAQRQAASVYFAGGVGIEQDLAVGGFIYGRISSALTATTSSQLLTLATNVNDEFFPTFTNKLIANKGVAGVNNQQDISADFMYGDPTGVGVNTTISADTHLSYNPKLGRLTLNKLHITSPLNSISTNTGAVVVDGGVGIKKDIQVGGNIYPGNTLTSTIGTITDSWASAYLDNIYTKFLGNANGNVVISPNNGINYPSHASGGLVDIYGDLRVRGNNPIGTGPVVTNVLYVTMDGDDTNDGRAQDPSRACRTITGAVKSPYYAPGTQIRVSPGHYLEDNPIYLKPYTSIFGSDIRTTGVEPINKTQDLFHMNSGCYLAFMQFLNGRSGLLPGQYKNGFNRGAYCTAFPPLPPGQEIDLFHSPYIQNCTNLTGPWLVDGTMFVPDETVQVPVAVGVGTWPANTTTIIINFSDLPVNGFINTGVKGSSSTQYTGDLQYLTTEVGTINSSTDLTSITGTALLDAYRDENTNEYWVYTNATPISLGQNIDSGQQNPGFFNARTLLLANKLFLQAQVVSYISSQILANLSNPSSIWYEFTYNQELCYRDVGFIVESIAYDAAFGGNQKSIEAGEAYWNGVVSIIGAEISQTINAIQYLETLVHQVIVNTACTVLPAVPEIPVANQAINIALLDGGVASASITNLFSTIRTIIQDGVSAAPASYTSTGPDAAYISAEVLLQSNRTFIQENTINYINWNLISGGPNYLPYNKIKCARDAGIIVDSLAADLLYPTSSFSQTTFAGLQYFAQNGYTGNIPSEITTATKAVSYLQTIANKIILNTTPADDAIVGVYRYSNSVQDTSNQPATSSETAILNTEFGIITNIMTGNTTGWTDRLVANGSPSDLPSVVNAYNSLIANVNYMVDEVYAYVTSSGGLNYSAFDTNLCKRDVTYIINSVAFDLLHGGNRQAIQSGLSYYNQVGGASLIPKEASATAQAFTFLGDLVGTLITQPAKYVPYQSLIKPVMNLPLVSDTVTNVVTTMVSTLTNIILNGPAGYQFTPISLDSTQSSDYANAHDIIEANRAFIVAETLQWIDFTFNSQSAQTVYVYNQEKCARDTGLIVEAIALDMLYPTSGNSQTTFAGIQYWNHGSYTGAIGNELTTTTNAINYLKSIAQQAIVNVTTGTRYQSLVSQYTGSPAATSAEQAIVGSEFDIITTILTNGPNSATDSIVSNGLSGSTNTDVQHAYTTLINNINYFRAEVIAYISATDPTFNYDQTKCARDVTFIIDSIAFDLLHGGNRQAIQSGVYYYGYDASSTALPGEVTKTIDAYNYIKSIIGDVILGNAIVNPQQTAVLQNTTGSTGTAAEAVEAQTKIDIITDIIANGPTVANTPMPISLSASGSSNVSNAANMLITNQAFIVAETIAYVNNIGSGHYSYNQTSCARDTKLIVDALAQDLLFGGTSQTDFAGIQYWNHGSYVGAVGSELTTTTNAINYIKSLAQKIVVGDVSGLRYSTATQVTGMTTATAAEAAIIGADFDIVTNILTNGVAGVTNAIVPNGIVASSTASIQHAYDLLQANKDYLEQEAIAYVDYGPAGGYIYDKVKCSRDTGLLVDAIALDMLYPTSSDSQSTFAGIQYWNHGSYVGAIANELTTTTNAINYLNGLAQKIIVNDATGTRYSTGTQVTGVAATSAEQAILAAEFTTITDILVNGVAGVTDIIVPNGITASSTASIQHAATLLQSNKTYLENEVIAYITSTAPTFNYDHTKCQRDVGYMIDSITFDLLHGGNKQAVQSGVYYYGYNGSSTAIPGELTRTVDAYNYIKSIIGNIILGNAIVNPQQTAVSQVTSSTPGTAAEAVDAQTKIDTIINIIAKGPIVASSPTPITLTVSGNANIVNAAAILEANRDFIRAETIAFIDSTAGNYTYDSAKCLRDTEIIVASLANDLLYPTSGNSQSTFAGIQYWNHGSYVGAIANELTTTTNALTYAMSLVQKIVVNDTSGTRWQSTVSQNTGLPAATSAEQSFIDVEFQTIISILDGSSPLSTITDTIIDNLFTSSSTGQQNAVNLIAANKTYIQEEVIAYISLNNPGYAYNTTKCRRDVSFILDSISADMLHASTRQAIQCGVYYYGYNASSSAIPYETARTVEAYEYLKSLISDVILGNPVPSPQQTVAPQVVSGTPGTAAEVIVVQNNVDYIIDIIVNGPTVASAPMPISLTASSDANVANAFAMLRSNVNFIAAEVVAFVNNLVSSYSYDKVKCARDVGYIVDSVSFDLLYGGNKQAIQSGVYYYSYNFVSSAIPNEVTKTIDAYDYLKSLISNIILGNQLPDPQQVAISQVTGMAPGTATEVVAIQNNIERIKNIIINGPGLVSSKTPIGLTMSGSSNVQHAAAILEANKEFIAAEIIAFINNGSTGYLYNEATCARDTGLIVDAIALDLLYPTTGLSQSTFAGIQYWNHGSYVGAVGNELTTTTNAINYAKSLAQHIVVNSTTGTRYQSILTQNVSLPAATSAEATTIGSEFTLITNILSGTTSLDVVTNSIIPNGLFANTDTNVQNAYALLEANKSYIQAEVIAYITSTAPTFEYDKGKCARDVSFMIDSVAFDLLHGGNKQAIQSGVYYYGYNSSSSAIPNEISKTLDAYNFLSGMLGNVIQGLTIQNTQQTAVLQVTLMPTGTIAEVGMVQASVKAITDIILSGPSVAAAPMPINLNMSGNTNVQNTAAILEANRDFIIAETVAFVNNSIGYVYNQQTCARDTGLIIDAIAADLLHESQSDSTFAGLQYWSQNSYTGKIASELTTATAAINYLGTLAVGYASTATTATVANLFNLIETILVNGVSGVTNRVKFGNDVVNTATIGDAETLQSNKAVMINDVLAYVATTGFTDFDQTLCARDVGFIIDAVTYDLAYGGNVQSIKSGVYYWGYSNSTVIPTEMNQTVAAYKYLKGIVSNIVMNVPIANPLQVSKKQSFLDNAATFAESATLQANIDNILDIITNGDNLSHPVAKTPQTFVLATNPNNDYAWKLLQANREFILAEIIAYVNANTSGLTYRYNEDLCYRDIGLMVDAVSQDILLGGNQRSIECGVAYWNKGFNYVANELSTVTQAINYIRDISLQIIANTPVTVITGTVATQVINTIYQYGGDYMPQQAIARGYQIISDIINNGVDAAPEVFAGGGVYALTGLNGADVKPSPTITSIEKITDTQYAIGLSQPTVGFGHNATLYIGQTYVYPIQDTQVETLSLQQTGSKNSWDERKVDPIGGMGGSLVDGAVISARSPIQSFVYDAFTQLTQGGRGIHVTNNGYAQLVSVFTIFCSVAVQVDNGGIASITNSNCNFGDLGLVAKGYGPRSFSGTVYNPKNRAYPFSPEGISGSQGLDPYYPDGFWPYKGTVEVFVPDLANRPHISLVMEIVPPTGYVNPLNSTNFKNEGLYFDGFLITQPSTSTLVAGSIDLIDIDTTGVAVGHNVYILDQFGSPYDKFQYIHDEFGNYLDINGEKTTNPADYIENPTYGIWYAATGTTVVDVNFNTITLNTALTSGASFPDNNNYFTLYFCGNSYYTVQTSTIADNPYVLNTNILSANSNKMYQGPATSQISQHSAVLGYLNSLIDQVVANIPAGVSAGNTATQYINGGLAGGEGTQSFIDLRFGYLRSIVTATNLNSALSVVPSNAIAKTGAVPAGAGSAISLIQNNIKFMGAEIYAYVNQQFPGILDGSTSTDQQIKCERDVELICQQLIYDLETGGNYNMVYSGLSYWSRAGTYHIVELGEAVTDPSIFPDGAIVNFYQRSYISASGYLFEYVGAGSNYGSLPQAGQADPIQKQETVQLDGGKVFFTSTDQNGDFRIGPSLVISQATGVISGRTFTESLFANMTPFILAIETL